MLRKALHFLRQAHSEENGLPSSRRIIFAFTIVSSISLLAFDVLKHGGFRTESLTALDTLVWSTAAYVGVTRALNK